MPDYAECQHCENEFEFDFSEVEEREDMDYEGRWFVYYVVVCPHCQEYTRTDW